MVWDYFIVIFSFNKKYGNNKSKMKEKTSQKSIIMKARNHVMQ